MAKATKRWAVRNSKRDGGGYLLFIGPRPRRTNKGWNSDVDGYCCYECSAAFERFCPKRFHLPLDGGPVEIRFANEA